MKAIQRINKSCSIPLTGILLLALFQSLEVCAAVSVQTEQLNPADPEWAFKTIPRPSKSDVAQGAKVAVVGNEWHPGGGGKALVNGRLPTHPNELIEEGWLHNGNTNDGSIVIDLGSVQPVKAVCSYSWHENPPDQGCRGPQVYTLSGSASGTNWTKIAEVDTRPNKTGQKWNGQHGVFISDSTGDLGSFRFLMFATQRTRSPLQRDAGVTGTLFAEIDIHTAATLAKAGDATVGPDYSNVKEIIVVCKTHFDIGYTHRVKDLLDYYRTTMIDRAMGVMDASKELPPEQQFVWTSPGWVMQKVLDDWPGQTPERRARLETAMKSGKFVTHALPFTIEAELLEPEQFARGYVFADTISRKYNLPLARSGKTTDVPSQSRSLATGLARGGVKFMHIGCNWPSGYVHDMPPIFWWEGPDGSRVMTIYSPCYGTTTAFTPWGSPGDPWMGHGLIPPADWPYKTWAAIIVTSDNSGPPNADGVKKIFAEVAKKLPHTKVRMGTMEEFADAIIAETTNLPVVKGESPDTWIHGCMCDPGGIKTARNSVPLLAAVEALNTQLRGWGVDVVEPASELARAHENALLYNEHTWGGAAAVRVFGEAFQKEPADKYKNLEGSWEDKTDYIRTAGAITTSLLQSNLAALAKAVKREGPRVVVFNPLPWSRSGIVDANGQTILAENVPACGYLTIAVPAAKKSEVLSADTVENEFFKVKLDAARGAIASFVDKRTGREWVDFSAERGLGQYLNERFDKTQTDGYCRDYQQGRWGNTLHPGMSKPGLPADVPYRAASSGKGTLKITRDGVSETAVMDFPGDAANHFPASSLRVTLHRGQPFVDLEITIKDKAKDDWPEADWLCLPFKVTDPQFRVGRNLGLMNPATDILRGANQDLYAVGAGVSIADADGAGIAVCPLDHPLVSLDRPGCWKFSLDFAPKKPAVFVNLYNNQWNTNYRYWYPGTWSSRVRVWTFAKGETPDRALMIPSFETRNPLLAAVADGPGGSLPESQYGIRVSRPGVLVTAFEKNPAENGTLLRVWEQSGIGGELTITLPKNFASAKPVDLRGSAAGNPVAVAGGAFTINLGAYAPASFVLDL